MIEKRGKKASEIEYKNDKQWINSIPLKLEKITGKVVLLDFWAYSCVNCVRTLPALKKIWNKYKKKRFIMIGIHTPEFEFEKEIGNVKYAVKKHGIDWPILSDPERNNWENYGNTYWPRAAVIDSNGNVIFEHVGESGYDEIDNVIYEELRKMGEFIGENENDEKIEEKKKYAVSMSRETYAGSLRGSEISGLSCTKEGCDEYVDSGVHETGKIYLQGMWKRKKEYLEYVGKDYEGWISFRFYAKEVNSVIGGVGKAEVELEGIAVNKINKSLEIAIENGKTVVKVEGADMYNIVKIEDYHSMDLKIKAFNGMKVYAYTFG